MSIYRQEQLWNSEKADWYWAPRVTNWIEKLRERRAPTTLIDSAVMKHLWGKHPGETCVRVAAQRKVKSQGKVKALHGTRMAECPWARENGSIQALLRKKTPQDGSILWKWCIKLSHLNPQPLWKCVEVGIHTVLNRSPGFPPRLWLRSHNFPKLIPALSRKGCYDWHHIHYKMNSGLQRQEKKGFVLYFWNCQVKNKKNISVHYWSFFFILLPLFAPEDSLEISKIKSFSIGLSGEILIFGSAFIA